MEFTFAMVKMDAQALEGSAGIANMNVSGDTFMYHAKSRFLIVSMAMKFAMMELGCVQIVKMQTNPE